MSEFGELYLKYYAIHEAIDRLLATGTTPIDPDAALAKLVELHPEMARSMPDLRREIVVAARQNRVPLKDGHE